MIRYRQAFRLKIAAVSAAVAYLAACSVFPKEEKILAPPLLTPPEVSYDLVEVKKGTIESKVVVLGTFIPVDLTSLFFRSGGRLKSILVKPGGVVQAGTLVAELDTGNLESRIEQQKLLLRKAKVTSERTVMLGGDKYQRELASIDVELANLQLGDLESELGQSRLHSSKAGIVIYLAQLHEGESVEPYRTVAQIADPRKLQLRYQGDSTSDFSVGMKVNVSVHDRNYTGEVVMSPGTVPSDASTEMKNEVLIQLPKIPVDVQSGDSATITLILQRRENVIVIPIDLVQTFLGRDFVEVMEDGVKKERTVELGVATATEVEVTKGLTAGEKVISR